MTENDENFFDKCKTCQYCYTKQNDDYVYCRRKDGKCEYKPHKSKNPTNHHNKEDIKCTQNF